MSNTTVTVVPAVAVIPEAVRTALVKAVEADQSSYGARRDFAASINAESDLAWYNLEAMGQKLPAVIAAIKTEYYAGLKGIGYSNPSNAWRMVKQYAKEDAANRGLFGETADAPKAEGETTEAEAGGDTRTVRSVQTRLVEDSKILLDFLMREKVKGNLEPKHEEYLSHLINGMKSIGMTVGI
jgi:hypothetical protein